MCGIAAIYGQDPTGDASRMLDLLTHRGPDDEGAVRVDGAWLGHRRLSIVDVDGGHQPFANATGDVWLVGNGEVYNHEQVRSTLAPAPFATRSDNEVALHLLDERGPAALDELEGMFAFLVAGEDGRFIAARDPVGIKPLYWAQRDGEVRFASEIAAFSPDWMPHVEAFPPGCHWTPERGIQRFASAVPRARRGRARRRCGVERRRRAARQGARRHARHRRRVGAAPDDGRRARRRVPLGRA